MHQQSLSKYQQLLVHQQFYKEKKNKDKWHSKQIPSWNGSTGKLQQQDLVVTDDDNYAVDS